MPSNPSQIVPSDPFGDEAMHFTKDLVMQREARTMVRIVNIT